MFKRLFAFALAIVMFMSVDVPSWAREFGAESRVIVNGECNKEYCLWNDIYQEMQTWNCIKVVIPCSGTMTIKLTGPTAEGITSPWGAVNIFKTLPYTYEESTDGIWKRLELDGKSVSKSASYSVTKGTYYLSSGLDGLVSYTFTPSATSFTYNKNVSKKTLSLKWKKIKGVDGYQVQYGRNSDFSSAKTVTLKKDKTVSYKARKLTKKKYYYVRVRTYKTIGTVTCYSNWSSVKKIKIKK